LADDFITDDLRGFILKYIDSIAQLEALLLLRRHSDELWTADIAAKRLYISAGEAASILQRLCADGLLSCDEGRFRFAGQPEEQRQMVERLASAYTRHLIQVTNLVHSKPRRLREFSDAFKFRKDRS
jgi:hypothetical protein